MTPSLPFRSGPAQKRRIPELDGLRAVSVMLVITYHLWLYAKIVSVPVAWSWLIDYLGPLGVKIFFVISGFIITRLMLEEVAATGAFSARAFFIKRVFRIIPAYWIYLGVITLLVGLGCIRSDAWNVIYCLLFTSDFWQVNPSFFYAHTWSLSVEEQYYLLFPLVVGLLRRKGLRATTIILVAVYLFALFSPNLGKILRLRFHLIDIGFLTSFRYIIGGVLLSLWWESFGPAARRAHGLFPVAVLTSLFGMVYFLSSRPESAFIAKYGFMLIEPAAITLLLGWVLERPTGFGFLRLASMQWLGRCSYSLYLWQQLFTCNPASYLSLPHPGALGSIGLLLLCAAASYHFIERPLNSLGRRLQPLQLPDSPRPGA